MQPKPGENLLLAALLAAPAGGLLLWSAAACSALLTGHHPPGKNLLAGYKAFTVPGDPSRAWHTPVGHPLVYWTATLVVLAAAAVLGGFGWRLWQSTRPAGQGRRPHPHRPPEGLATRSEVVAAAGARHLLTRAATLRPSVTNPRPVDVGYRLGTAHRVECWASVEDSMLLIGPPRSGKGMNLVIPMILDAPGAVVTTSTRPDNLAVTYAARASRGPVLVFDPGRLAGPRVERLAWPLARGCEEPRVAILRAETLVADAARAGVENAAFWRTQAATAVRCLLHAAALDGRPAAEIYRWSMSAARAREAVAILAAHPSASPGWDTALDAIIGADPRTRDSVWAMVANAFSPLADPDVLAAVTPTWGALDPDEFLAAGGTAYLIGTAAGAAPTAPLIAALVEDLVDAARRRAARSPGQRLDPPLGLLLDEAANYPLPSLPALMSEGGGSGITTLAVLQSLAQARDRWGRDAAGAIWDSAIVKIILGGSANADDLADISRLIGEREVEERSETTSASGRSVSTARRTRPILDPSDIRRLPVGSALLLLRAAPPILMRLTPWTARADAAELQAARRAWEQSVTGEPARA